MHYYANTSVPGSVSHTACFLHSTVKVYLNLYLPSYVVANSPPPYSSPKAQNFEVKKLINSNSF